MRVRLPDTFRAMPTPPGPLNVRTLRAIVLGVLLPIVFVAAFVYPGHDPRPNGLPVAVAQDRPLPDGVDAVVTDDPRRAVLDREAYGALLPDRTLVASGASSVVAGIVTGLGGGRPVEDVAPLAEGDPRGTTLNLLVLPIIITSILGALLAMQLAPDLPTRGRILVVALIGVLAAVATLGIVKAFDALPGSFLAEAGLLALTVMGIALVASALIRLIGPPGVLVSFLLFLVLGNPASGLATAPELLPTPWHPLGALLPPGALGDALRGTAYFDGAGVLAPVLVLLAWLVVGLGLQLLADRRARGHAAAAPAPAG